MPVRLVLLFVKAAYAHFVFADVLFVDLAKYADERVATVKSHFETWLHLALWHKPTILILDNLDRIVPAEVDASMPFTILMKRLIMLEPV